MCNSSKLESVKILAKSNMSRKSTSASSTPPLNYFISPISCYRIRSDKYFISGLDERWLLLANRKNVLQASLDGNNYNYVLTKLNRTVAIDYDINEGSMYWADVIDNTIYRTSITFDQGGSHPSEVSYVKKILNLAHVSRGILKIEMTGHFIMFLLKILHQQRKKNIKQTESIPLK